MTDDGLERPGRPSATEPMDHRALTISARQDGATHTIGLSGELDIATVDALSEAITRAEAASAAAIVIDLEDLTFIDSSGIRLILLTHLRAVAGNGRLRLRRGPPEVQRVFAISGIEDELRFVD